MAALRNLIVGICRLRGITRISRQLRHNSRDPYQRPLILLAPISAPGDRPYGLAS
jgi:hypothetical protein